MKFSVSHFEWYVSELSLSQLRDMLNNWDSSPTYAPHREILKREMVLRNV